MLTLILSALYFFLPAAIANMMPVLTKNIQFLNISISPKWLGKNKTYRGFFFGFLGALIILIVQYFLQKYGIVEYWSGDPSLSLSTAHSIPRPLFGTIDYQLTLLPLYAFIFGIGALAGDSIKSFFKRRLKIKPGRPFVPFDQIDFVLGVYVFFWIFSFCPSISVVQWPILITLLIVIPFLHFLSNVIGYLIGIKKVWW